MHYGLRLSRLAKIERLHAYTLRTRYSATFVQLLGQGVRHHRFVRCLFVWPIASREQCRRRIRVEWKCDAFFFHSLLFVFFQ